MKRVSMIVGLFCLMAVCAASAADTNFAGTWALDKEKSEGLRQGAGDQTWTVTQDAKALVVERPGFGRAGGAAPAAVKSTYNLDGSETSTESTGRRAGKTTSTAKWGEGNKTLDLTSVFKGKNQAGDDVTATTKQKWELADEGKTLKVAQTREGGGGGAGGDSKMVFTKK